MEAFGGLDADSLVQEFIREAGGASLRLLVVGKRVVAAMRRQARPGEFRSNLHRGGKAEKLRPSPQERRLAIRAAEALGLHVAGVDMLQSSRGPLVMAVNSSPELEAIERATGIDVAGKIIESLAAAARRPAAKTARSPSAASGARRQCEVVGRLFGPRLTQGLLKGKGDSPPCLPQTPPCLRLSPPVAASAVSRIRSRPCRWPGACRPERRVTARGRDSAARAA